MYKTYFILDIQKIPHTGCKKKYVVLDVEKILWWPRYIRLCLHTHIHIHFQMRSVITPAYFLQTFDLSLTWFVTCNQVQYYIAEKFPTLFPFSHLFVFLNYLTGSNISYQVDRKFTEQQTAVSDGTQNRQRWHTECQNSLTVRLLPRCIHLHSFSLKYTVDIYHEISTLSVINFFFTPNTFQIFST